MRTALVLLLPFLVVVFQFWLAVVVFDCTATCGDIKVPYPFGTEAPLPNCPRPRFKLICNYTFDPPRLMLGSTEVINISYAGQITMLSPVNFDCYNKLGERIERNITGWKAGKLLAVSDTENKFTTMGCDTISDVSSCNEDIEKGCNMSCTSQSDVIDGSCKGEGCCQTTIPKGFGSFNISLRSLHNHTKVYDFNPCSYAFIVQSSWFNFRKSYLTNFTTSYPRYSHYYVPVVWDWAVSLQNCDDAQKKTTYACRGDQNKSKCVPSKNDRGYSCICSDGYGGNPYLDEQNGGCTDVNECKRINNCTDNAICKNKIGSYSCCCPWGYRGNGWRSATSLYGTPQEGRPGCTNNVVQVIAGVSASIIVLPITMWFLYRAKKERERMKCFQENGGKLLKRKINSHEVVKQNLKFFGYAELKSATENFNGSKKLTLQNDSDFCEVFKGSQEKVYTVKRYKEMDRDQIIQFVNEVDALSQINHPHVVKLLGCCLDTKTPMLVYESVSNQAKTLSQCIHSGDLSWEDRKRIAAEMADALSYLVLVPMPPIFHGNFRSSDVLIEKDETSGKLVAKVCDFEASRLIPLYQAQYHQAQINKKDVKRKDEVIEFTEKSVVYSFGVVLWELLGKKEPVNFDNIWDDGNKEPEKVKQVVELVKNCLQDQSKDRPTMKEVAEKLRQVEGELGQVDPSSSSSSAMA